MQNMGRVHVAAFSDEALFTKMLGKAAFWQQLPPPFSIHSLASDVLNCSAMFELNRNLTCLCCRTWDVCTWRLSVTRHCLRRC